MREPILQDEDLCKWKMWERTCRLHAKTRRFSSKVRQAKNAIYEFHSVAPDARVSWSMGKDSTAMVHLVCVEIGITKRCVWRKDDLCFPGEQEYADELSGRWGLDLDIVTPPRTKREVFAAAHITDPGDVGLHKRAPEDSFKGQMDAYWREQDHPGYYVGLRAEESKGRTANRKFRGEIYKRGSDWVCQPLVDWSGLDVFAYLFSKEIEPFHIYRCCGYHDDPRWIRLGGFLAAARFTAEGQIAWLRHYYPSVYRELLTFMPGAKNYV